MIFRYFQVSRVYPWRNNLILTIIFSIKKNPENWRRKKPPQNLVVLCRCFSFSIKRITIQIPTITLPETNSKSPWKWMVGIRSFPFGMTYLQGQAVSFREGNFQDFTMVLSFRWHHETGGFCFFRTSVARYQIQLFWFLFGLCADAVDLGVEFIVEL